MVHTNVRTVDADLLRRDGQLDGLQERILGIAHQRPLDCLVVAEREESDAFHTE